MDTDLIRKYNVPGPRYTSYPTVPFWEAASFSESIWLDRLLAGFLATNRRQGISLYIHLPYCESLCTFCGCNKRITRNHAVEERYIKAVLAEWNLYCDRLPEKPQIAELHLGGGTPSFFSAENLKRLLDGLFSSADRASGGFEYGWEGHPNNTSREHLNVLYDSGFRRVSFGVQDYDPTVQRAIHRMQPVENVQRVTEWAREIGYTSISHDLIYGLPFQKPDSIRQTVLETRRLRPDRISFYSYAHVPWIKGNGQRGFQDEDLPSGTEKRALYEIGRELLEMGGYSEIGMDHFALPHDALYQARQNGALHRNFMGYTTTSTRCLIGLGVSAIGDAGTAFAQNEKEIDAYINRVLAGELPLMRGHGLTETDGWVRHQIQNIMCRFKTGWNPQDWSTEEWSQLKPKLEAFYADGLITYHESGLIVTEKGRPFLRNICMAFDRRLNQAQPIQKLFSQTV
ncbi:oxygen-independent coproporphyrinogen III oxidase [Larkinella rosea]|uniref:Coproporphyrinogen-III oxidase n=1 Tax=Larkinella rosea TaxID=2025312 RepID=A0A3P1C0P8_9BACT|nr:oxygen-independent coproporphyrinogen III oxidase [Larkinella rosea]RRB06980.1 oxygen-independent coproporphyrinogen III oxidase [Larkinella rosea]